MANAARIWIWCEDREHERFVRTLLVKLGVSKRCLRFQIAPSGQGSASQWVFKRYVEVCRLARAKKNQTTLGFLVMVDGDADGLTQRMTKLEGKEKRGDHDRIAVWIPTWSVETWVLWLTGDDVSEAQPYKGRCDFNNLLAQAVTAWDQPRTQEQEHLPSLSAARSELRRLPL